MKKHSSYDSAPDKPFWKKKAEKSKCSPSIGGAVCVVSPSKCVNLRGQCISQLLQLHQLLGWGGIS